MNEGRFQIYIATGPNGKQYVGCTSRSVELRWRDHRYIIPRVWPGEDDADISDAIKRYGADSFTVEHVASATTQPDAWAIERALIVQNETLRPHGYNRNAGGPGPIKGARYAA